MIPNDSTGVHRSASEDENPADDSRDADRQQAGSGASEHGASEHGSSERGTSEQGQSEVGPTEVGPTEVGPTEWGTQVGVGPWEGEWPADEHYDPELLEHGDRRNVVDHYRYWSRRAIVADLDRRRHGFHVAIENFQHDHNIGTVVRTANAFAAREVHIVGRRRWNRRGAMVTDRYQHVRHHPGLDELRAYAEEHSLRVVAVDNTPGATPIERVELPADCVLLFGQEGPGLGDDSRRIADLVVSIAQFGSTRSINAGVASGIVMHTWIRQHARLENAW